MDSSGVRGALLVAIAVALGAAVFWFGLKDPPATADTARAVSVSTEEPTAVPTATTAPTEAVAAVAATATPPPLAVPNPATSIKHDPSEVTVQVANGARVDGLAGKITSRLGQRNYVMRGATNAIEEAPVSIIYYEEGYDGDAQEIKINVLNTPTVQILPMPDPLPEVGSPEPGGVNILIVAGADEMAQL